MEGKKEREVPLADDRTEIADSDEQKKQRTAEQKEIETRHKAQGLNADGSEKRSES